MGGPWGAAAVLSSVLIIIFSTIPETTAVRCYMCATSGYAKGDDHCGAYKTFDKEEHIAIECNSEESPMPGSFCMKIVQQGRRGFIWDGRWRQVIRRCASVADTGVTGVCNWGVYENGVYWEECYCSSDECNSAYTFSVLPLSIILLFPLITVIRLL